MDIDICYGKIAERCKARNKMSLRSRHSKRRWSTKIYYTKTSRYGCRSGIKLYLYIFQECEPPLRGIPMCILQMAVTFLPCIPFGVGILFVEPSVFWTPNDAFLRICAMRKRDPLSGDYPSIPKIGWTKIVMQIWSYWLLLKLRLWLWGKPQLL